MVFRSFHSGFPKPFTVNFLKLGDVSRGPRGAGGAAEARGDSQAPVDYGMRFHDINGILW
jgi:hypothetical protein